MPRGNDQQTKVHYKGKDDDFIVFVESADAVKEWKADKSVPLAQVVGGWKVFITHKYVFLTSQPWTSYGGFPSLLVPASLAREQVRKGR